MNTHPTATFLLLLISAVSFAASPEMNCKSKKVDIADLSTFIKKHHSELLQYGVKDDRGHFLISTPKAELIKQNLCRMLDVSRTKCDVKLISDKNGSALGYGVLAIRDQDEPLFLEPTSQRVFSCTPRPSEFEYAVSDNGESRLLLLTHEDGWNFGVMFDSSGEGEAIQGPLLRGPTQRLFTLKMKQIELNHLKGTINFMGKHYARPTTDQTDQAFGYATATPENSVPKTSKSAR
jgi:hypothetical protein